MQELAEFFTRHTRIALHFSGGKDSLAVLWLCQPYWEQIEVIWVNAGNPSKEVLEQMEQIAKLVPHFTVLRGRQPEWVAENGYPVEIVPFRDTAAGQAVHRREGIKLTYFANCCFANLWEPLFQYRRQKGFDGILSGTKDCDAKRPAIVGPSVMDGAVEYFFPVWNWSDEDVKTYLGDKLPEYYSRGYESSADCVNCTAYVSENRARLQELRTTNPTVAAEIEAVHKVLKTSLSEELALLEEIYRA